MIEDFVRAWRHIYKYVLGLVVALELGVLWLGPDYFEKLPSLIRDLVFGEPNAVIILTGVAFIAIVGSVIADMLFAAPLLALILLSRGPLARVLLWPKRLSGQTSLSWRELALFHPGRSLQIAIESDRGYLVRHLQTASLSNVAKQRGVEISDKEVKFFPAALETVLTSKNHELLWWTSYSHQFTQERRELDACQVEAANARSTVAAAVLALAAMIRVQDLLAPAALPLMGVFATGAAIAAFRAWLEARQRMVYYMVGLLIQLYMWGEQGAMEDRDSV